jgi:hypothetical protein
MSLLFLLVRDAYCLPSHQLRYFLPAPLAAGFPGKSTVLVQAGDNLHASGHFSVQCQKVTRMSWPPFACVLCDWFRQGTIPDSPSGEPFSVQCQKVVRTSWPPFAAPCATGSGEAQSRMARAGEPFSVQCQTVVRTSWPPFACACAAGPGKHDPGWPAQASRSAFSAR